MLLVLIFDKIRNEVKSMEIESISDNKWKKLLTEDIQYKFKSLALRILLSRLKINIRLSETSKKNEAIENCIFELKKFFNKLSRLPSIQEDLKIIQEEIK